MSFHRLCTFMQTPEAEDFTEVLALQISPEFNCHLDQLLTPRRVSSLTRDDAAIDVASQMAMKSYIPQNYRGERPA